MRRMNVEYKYKLNEDAAVLEKPSIQATFQDYLAILRIDHWAKNVFVLPGAIIGFHFFPETFTLLNLCFLFLGIFATCLVASSNYVINEYLDAPQDRFHPEKRFRPCAFKNMKPALIYSEWIITAVLGIALGFIVNKSVGVCLLCLWIMGCIYNIRPIRSKELPYLDVLSEALNNPLRMAIGWYAISIPLSPPISALFAYWMLGAFLMGTKRFAEYRNINNPEQAQLYRRSFKYYNEELLVSGNVFYLALFMTGMMAFAMLYKLELVFAIPLIAFTFAYYLHLGFQENSPVQYPEKLYKEKKLMLFVISSALLAAGLYLFANFQWFHQLFDVLNPSQLKY